MGFLEMLCLRKRLKNISFITIHLEGSIPYGLVVIPSIHMINLFVSF